MVVLPRGSCCDVIRVSAVGQDERAGERTDGKNNRENEKMNSVPVVSSIRVYHYAGTRMPFSLQCVAFENKMVELKRGNYKKEDVEKEIFDLLGCYAVSTLRNIPEERRYLLHRGGSQKSRTLKSLHSNWPGKLT